MTSTSVHQKFSGLLIVIGSLVFVCGGAFHPRINSTLGALGSTEFFQNFYMHIAHHGSWRLIHGMILAGPVLWLLGIGSLWSGRNGWTRMAATAMTLAATAWAVTFVFDGFVAPDIVRWLTPETGWHVLAVNQDVVIRLGLVSWLMLGFAMVAGRSEEHTSELQSPDHLVCRLLLEKKNELRDLVEDIHTPCRRDV